MYPSEYAYRSDSVYRSERDSANCRNYPVSEQLGSENYIHCDGTQLRLTDSDIGSEQFTFSDYYQWNAETGSSRLLFIFPTRVTLTTITLHYWHISGRGLPRLRFWAVPDDFDVWEAPTTSYSYVEVAAVPPGGGESAGHRNVSVGFNVTTLKLLMYKFRSTFTLAVSEAEFFTNSCSSLKISPLIRDSIKASNYYFYVTEIASTISRTWSKLLVDRLIN